MNPDFWTFVGLAWLACAAVSFFHGWIRQFHTWQWLGASALLGPLALIVGVFLTGRGRDVSLLQKPVEAGPDAGLPRISEDDLFRGRAFAYQVRELKRSGRLKEASEILEVLVEVSEEKSRSGGRPVHHWYYEQLANVHRKTGKVKAEASILKRYLSQNRCVDSSAEKRLGKRLADL